MSKEIKFRVWDSSPVKDGYKGIMINHEYLIKSNYLVDALSGKYPIMQFTGLTDKNGKEIYEGDIVNFRANYTNQPCGYFDGIVEIDSCSLLIKVDSREYIVNDETEGFDYNSEVLGNIYENPELLKQ